MTTGSCLIYRPRGHTFVAFRRGESKTALSFFPGTTWKKKAIALYLRTTDLLGVALPGVVLRSDIELFDTTINALRRTLDEKYAIIAQSFLLMHNREYQRQRAYLWCIDGRNNLSAFVKVGFGEDNRRDLQKEIDALTALQNMRIAFNAPKPLAFFQQDEMTILATSPLPSRINAFRYLPWRILDNHLVELRKKTRLKIAGSQLRGLDWYGRFLSQTKPETIAAMDQFFKDKDVDISFVHGDMGSENAFLFNENLWLVDWEKSSREGPAVTDEIAHRLGETAARTGLNKHLIDEFNAHLLSVGGTASPDIVLALCYLKTVGFPPAELVFDYFEHTYFFSRS